MRHNTAINNQPINVLHIIHSLTWGGAENQVVSLVPVLDNERYKIHVCCLRDEGVQASTLKARGIKIFPLKMRLRYWPLAVFRLMLLIKQIKPQILHTHMADACLWGTLAGRLAGVPIILTTEPGMALWKKRRHRLLERLVNLFTDKMIAVSDEIRQHLIANQVAPTEKIIIIPNAVDIECFNSGYSRDQIREDLRINVQSLIVGTVARHVQAKRLDHLLETARIVCDAVPQAQFLFVGDGPLREELEYKAGQLCLTQESVRFLGNIKDVTGFLLALDIFALSSETEGIPVAMLEAMAASKPVVATRVGGIPQVIQDGDNGLLVSAHDPAELANAILRLLEDKSLREDIAAKGFHTVLTLYSTHVVCQQIAALYDSLLEQKQPTITNRTMQTG